MCLTQAILLNDQPWTWSLTEAFLGLIAEMRSGSESSATVSNESPSRHFDETKEEVGKGPRSEAKKGTKSNKKGFAGSLFFWEFHALENPVDYDYLPKLIFYTQT